MALSRDLTELDYHPTAEKLVKILCQKTQNSNPLFFRVLVAYFFAKVASTMRGTIDTSDRGRLPINVYAMNLAVSGTGKGYSTNIMEDRVIHVFRERFMEDTFPIVAGQNLVKIANQRANRSGTDPDDELTKLQAEFDRAGELAFSFDSGTTAAVKQMRHKLLLADAGSVNLEIDEIGSNLMGNMEVLNAFLELYDVGKIKQKLTKNTAENTRTKEVDGKTPTNMLLFGTPDKLLNGGKIEEEFYSMLETGYARRCLFGYCRDSTKVTDLSAQEIYQQSINQGTDQFLDQLAHQLGLLADMGNFGKHLKVSPDVSIELIEYKLHCERKAAELGRHDELRKAELCHRYFKAIKLAGAYAFVDGVNDVTEDHLYNAIALVEESGKAFDQVLTREGAYVKLAKYIADVGREVTHTDLIAALPFYKGSQSQRQELLTLAIAWGYKNNVIVKKQFTDGIEFLKGESLQETDLSKMVVSYSDHIAFNYRNEKVPFDQLHRMTQADGFHWVSHHVVNGHRNEENALAGFNMVVIDVDGGISLDTAKLLLKDYKALYYTTKRHTPQANRFRIILPMNYTLKLDAKDYKEFMANIFEWLPFSVDDQTGQRARKWMSHNGHCEYVDGQLLDVLPFIPKTSKNEERKQQVLEQQNLSNLERWFLNNTGAGNRSNQLIKYALLLVDAGQDLDQVRNHVLDLNNKLPDKLSEQEVLGTILISASKAIATREAKAA